MIDTPIRAHTLDNPWGLTDIEYHSVQAYVHHGETEDAAAFLGVSVRSLENGMRRARERMQASTTVLMVAMWVRWRTRQEQAAAKPRTQWRAVEKCERCHGLGFVQRTAP